MDEYKISMYILKKTTFNNKTFETLRCVDKIYNYLLEMSTKTLVLCTNLLGHIFTLTNLVS